MRFGRFDDENKEYVIERPDTPRPWSNYIGNTIYGGIVTNNAQGYSFYRSAGQGRHTRFLFAALPGNYQGKYVYLHDVESKDFWSNSWHPVGKPLDQYTGECRHGAGYSVITGEYSGISSSVTYFAPLGATYEVWKVSVTNNSGKARKLRVFPLVEWGCNWNALDDQANLQYTQYIVKAKIETGIIDMGSNINMPEDVEHFQNKDQARHVFMGITGAETAGYDTQLEEFFGAWGNYARPDAVVQGACKNSLATGDMPCGAYQVDVNLADGETKEFAVVMGIGKAEVEGKAACDAMGTVEKVNDAVEKVKAFNHTCLGTFTSKTPDGIFDSMMNMWSPYNCMMTFNWSRAASMIYAGERDGLGFRDSLQDMLGAMALDSEEAGRRIELLLTGQLANGGAMPVVKPYAHNPGHEKEPEHYRADDCMWFFNAIPQYVKETGDIDFYKKVLPFADKGEATVLAHLRRAIQFNLDRLGAHGLPCGLHADWNDCLRLGEKGETSFVAFQLRYAFKEYIAISEMLGETAEVEWAKPLLEEYDKTLDTHVWDGEWYLRAYRDDGLKFGSKENEEGTIFMNPQAWAVISGHAQGEKAKKCIESLDKQLATKYGIMLCAPPFVKTDPNVVLAVLFNPGSKENAAMFNHTQGWAVMSQAILGNNDKAWEYLKSFLPGFYNDIADVRETEPYVVSQTTASKYNPKFGAGRVPWLSGAATWNYHAATQYILGVQPDYDGLRMVPRLPSHWPEATVTRKFRGKDFTITIKNGGNGTVVKQLMVNGETIDGDLIPADKFKDANTVEVTMG
ncbi:MAG: N,N'-diacetylchitobiose phosphorylase [Deltaproteobacteria bacterium]|nr:N,N'-diacetylchitobiose phosphorylase [Deltaproteobacteria bacterium]MBN2671563.1 N,N'-diacetylchitobiose phosphorylase [Deltaproteobacteria bacterium]